jgi:tetratricopeptide (TPR) repeat protein
VVPGLCGLALALLLSGGAVRQAPQKPAQPATLDAVVSAYFGGDPDVVARTFARPRDFQDRLHVDDPKELERWLGSFDQRKAVVLLEMARTAAQLAPRHATTLIKAGGGYLGRIDAEERKSPEVAAFVQSWHRIAVGLLEGADDPTGVEVHVDDAVRRSARGSSPGPDARLVLARAVAQERRCWDDRPVLDQAPESVDAIVKAAGMLVTDAAQGPTKAARDAKATAYAACLREALTRLDTAAGLDETRAEARVRTGWILFQQDRLPDALAALDGAQPGDDRELAYWRSLFRGRVLTAIGRADDAEAAYRSALALFPSAQSAGIGRALVLVRLDRVTEADQAARALRTGAVVATDPWSFYGDADRRFVDRWIVQLRGTVR